MCQRKRYKLRRLTPTTMNEHCRPRSRCLELIRLADVRTLPAATSNELWRKWKTCRLNRVLLSVQGLAVCSRPHLD